MVRVLFLASPFKAHMIQQMIERFTPRIVSEVATLLYPYSSTSQLGLRDKVLDRFLPRTTSGRELTNLISSFEPDIVYADSPLYATQQYISSAIAKRRIPVVLHLRGNWWQEYADWFLSASWRKRVLSLQSFAFQYSGELFASKITPICKWLEKIVQNRTVNRQTEVVYQGIDPENFFPEEGFTFRRPGVAIIQNHTIFRKVAGLLNFRAVIARLPETHFYIAEGEAVPQSFLVKIKQEFSSLPNVRFVSGISSIQAVREMLTASDCYVLASGLDCCPTTVLEASLMGKPVIASRIGGVPEIVLEGQTGWTIDNNDIDGWVEKLQLVLSDSKLNRSLGRRGREWVSEKFSWDVIARQVEAMLVSEIQ